MALALRYPEPHLADAAIRLRPWSDGGVGGDLACVARACRDAAITPWTSLPDPDRYTEADGRAYLTRQSARLVDGRGMTLAIVGADDDAAIGQVGLGVRPQPDVVGLGYWVLAAARGRGLASAAARLLTDWALGPGGAVRVEAWVAPINAASLGVLRAAGFTREGLLRSFLLHPDGRHRDMVVLSRVRAG